MLACAGACACDYLFSFLNLGGRRRPGPGAGGAALACLLACLRLRARLLVFHAGCWRLLPLRPAGASGAMACLLAWLRLRVRLLVFRAGCWRLLRRLYHDARSAACLLALALAFACFSCCLLAVAAARMPGPPRWFACSRECVNFTLAAMAVAAAPGANACYACLLVCLLAFTLAIAWFPCWLLAFAVAPARAPTVPRVLVCLRVRLLVFRAVKGVRKVLVSVPHRPHPF